MTNVDIVKNYLFGLGWIETSQYILEKGFEDGTLCRYMIDDLEVIHETYIGSNTWKTSIEGPYKTEDVARAIKLTEA